MPVYLPDTRDCPVIVSHPKSTWCGQCGSEYSYEVVSRPNVREVDADAAVPCPTCGWVQEHMIAAERRRMYPRLKKFVQYGLVTWAFLLTAPLVISGAVLGMPGGPAKVVNNFTPGFVILWGLLPVVMLSTFTVWSYRGRLVASYDPNRECAGNE